MITPPTVSDLTVGSMDFTASTFEIKFTWPGKQLDVGKVADYKVGGNIGVGFGDDKIH